MHSSSSYLSRSECLLCLDSPSALTRIALRPLTGHSCSQIPHPVHRSGFTCGVWRRTCSSILFRSAAVSSGETGVSRVIEFCEFERTLVLEEVAPLSTKTKKSPVANRSGCRTGLESRIEAPEISAASRLPSRTGAKLSFTNIALGLTGQFSWQTIHGLSMAQGRQRPRSMKAVPMRMGPVFSKAPRPSFSSSEMRAGIRAVRADMAACRAVHLAAARPGAHVQRGGPQTLGPTPGNVRLYNVGGANARALSAPDAAVEKFGFAQRPRRSNERRIVVLT